MTNIDTAKKLNKAKASAYALQYTVIVLAGMLNAIGIYIFILPNHFSPGGVTGLAVMFEFIFKIDGLSGILVFIMNIPLLILAFIYLNKEFVIKTAICIILSSILLYILPKVKILDSLRYTANGQTILPAIAGGCIGGFAIGLVLKLGGCNGGSEIIGRFIQRKFPAYNISWFIFIIDTAVVLITAFTISKVAAEIMNVIILSIIKMFCASIVCSTFLEGFNSALKFEIVTSHSEELSQDLINNLKRGVTKITVRGGYTNQEKTMLICIIRKREISNFQKILKNYPDTFAYIMNTKEVYGRGFSTDTKKDKDK